MKKYSLLLALMLLALSCVAHAGPDAPLPSATPAPACPEKVFLPTGTIRQHPLLDSAFEMLEQGNVFVERYNRLAHQNVVVRYQYGVPYFFGGRVERLLGFPRSAWQNSRFFVKGNIYVYGFDCFGLTQWIYKSNGWHHPEKISDTFNECANLTTRIPLMNVPFDRWREVLPIGALISLEGKYGNHIMLYVGTLHNYGFTGEDVGPALSPYLDYPLFIQSGNSLAAIKRNERYIAGLNRPWKVYDTDGGVCVSLVGVPQEAAPLAGQAGNLAIKFFNLRGQELLAYDISEKLAYYGWYPDTPPVRLRTPKVANAKTIPAPLPPAANPAAAGRAAKAGSDACLTDVFTLPSGPIKGHPVLDSAFEMLEEGNLFLTRYNELAKKNVVARHQYGVPFFIGGSAERYILTQQFAGKSDSFFTEGRLYLSGFDSIGFTQWAYRQNGWKHYRSIRSMMDAKTNKTAHIHVKGLPYDQWRTVLPIGALFAMSEGYAHHVMIYIGTLENYGFTEDSLPAELRPYRRYPLFIQCGKSPAAIERNARYIEGLARRWTICNTVGGVNVCMLGVPQSAAPVIGQAGKEDVRGFRLLEQELTVFPLGEKAEYYGWYPDAAPTALSRPKKPNTETIPAPTVPPAAASAP